MKVMPYLFFGGRCEEALAFYETVFGAKRGMTMRFEESPEPPPADMLPADWGSKIMHGEITIGETQVLASDGMCAGQGPDTGVFSLAVQLEDAAEVERVFNALCEGGEVQMPLAKTFFSERFGAVRDRFGVSWMTLVA